MTDAQKKKLRDAKVLAVFLVKKAGPTAAVLVLRAMKRVRTANALGAAIFGYEIYKEWKKRDDKKRQDGTPDKQKPDAS